MPGCIFMHTCMFPENGPDAPRCNTAPEIIMDKAACQQAALYVPAKMPRGFPS